MIDRYQIIDLETAQKAIGNYQPTVVQLYFIWDAENCLYVRGYADKLRVFLDYESASEFVEELIAEEKRETE